MIPASAATAAWSGATPSGYISKVSISALFLQREATYHGDEELRINDCILGVSTVSSDAEEWQAEELVKCTLAGSNLDAALLRDTRCASTDALNGVTLVLMDALYVVTKSTVI